MVRLAQRQAPWLSDGRKHPIARSVHAVRQASFPSPPRLKPHDTPVASTPRTIMAIAPGYFHSPKLPAKPNTGASMSSREARPARPRSSSSLALRLECLPLAHAPVTVRRASLTGFDRSPKPGQRPPDPSPFDGSPRPDEPPDATASSTHARRAPPTVRSRPGPGAPPATGACAREGRAISSRQLPRMRQRSDRGISQDGWTAIRLGRY